MFNRMLILSAVAIATAGCSGIKTPAPVVQKRGTLATLTVPVLSEQWKGGTVQLATNNKRGCGELSNNLLPATFQNDFALDIEGGRDVFFHISREDERAQCNEFGLFYASKGNEYTLNLQIKDQQCVLSLTAKTPGGTPNNVKIYPAYASAVNGIKVCTSKDLLY